MINVAEIPKVKKLLTASSKNGLSYGSFKELVDYKDEQKTQNRYLEYKKFLQNRTVNIGIRFILDCMIESDDER